MKLCFVVQRYGLEVNGGAELHCMQLAEHMLPYCSKIDVLTTKAIDYMTWKNEYTSDVEDINGICVRRFAVEAERNQEVFDEINARFMLGQLKVEEEQEWIDKQGPLVPSLVNYLKEHQYDYDCIIFFAYLYYPSVMGIRVVDNKVIMLPLAHDEPFLKMKIFDPIFKKPDAFFFNTEEERNLVVAKYKNENIKYNYGGVGVDVPDDVNAKRFKEKYNLDNYIVYVGRIDEGKNCPQLFNYFCEYKKRFPNSDLKLVLMGKAVIPVPQRDDIISLGFVSDEDKFDGIAGAHALVLPSKFESLSMVVLEAMYLRTSVIVNGECPVLRGHVLKSNGAFYYNNYFEFEAQINYLYDNYEVAEIMKDNALEYVQKNYQWSSITNKLCNLIKEITSDSQSKE